MDDDPQRVLVLVFINGQLLNSILLLGSTLLTNNRTVQVFIFQ